MLFLADESCDFAVVRALRAAGHDVKAVAEVALGALDEVVFELASRERRVLLTEDSGEVTGLAGSDFSGASSIAWLPKSCFSKSRP